MILLYWLRLKRVANILRLKDLGVIGPGLKLF